MDVAASAPHPVAGRIGRGLELLLTTVVLLTLAITGALLMLLSANVLSPSDLAVEGSAIYPTLDSLDAWTGQYPRWALVGGAGLGVGCLLLLFARMSGASMPRRAAQQHLLEADDRGFVVVDSRGVGVIAARAASRAPGVVDCTVRVQGDGATAVSLRLDVYVHPGTPVKEATRDVRASTREAIEQLVGLEVRQVGVRAHVLEPEALVRAVW